MTRLVLFGILVLTLVSAIANAADAPAEQPSNPAATTEPPLPETNDINIGVSASQKSETINDIKINIIDIDVKASQEATEDFKEDAWLEKCTFIPGKSPNPSKLKVTRTSAIVRAKNLGKKPTKDVIIKKIDVGYKSIAKRANILGKKFTDAYDKDTKQTTFTGIQFEDAKKIIDSLATRLKNIAVQLNKFNGEENRIKMVTDFCMKLLENKRIMGSVVLAKSQWNRFKALGYAGVKLGGYGQRATSKLYNYNNGKKTNKK